jgi:type II secretory pathway component GspD/PulD (secretin)
VRPALVRACIGAAGWAYAAGAAAGQAVPRPAPLPLTQYDERRTSSELDGPTFSLTFAQPVPVREALVAFVRDTHLSIATDAAAAGTFIGDLKDVTVRQALEAVLPPLGLTYAVDGSLIRVFRREPQTRIFDLNYIAAERTATATTGRQDGGGVIVSSTMRTDVFGEIAAGARALLSEQATLTVDRKAGLLQATDIPERLDRVAAYLETVQSRIQRQAQIEARVLEVELSDERASGIDWNAVSAMVAGPGETGRAGGRAASYNGLRVRDVTRLLTALESQGKVTPIASPRLLTLNNEPAIVRTEVVTFAVTPQISSDAHFTLSFSPAVGGPTNAGADMLARVADGETLVVSGIGRDREIRERKAAGISGGWFGRTTVVTRHRVELVILLTPRLLHGGAE